MKLEQFDPPAVNIPLTSMGPGLTVRDQLGATTSGIQEIENMANQGT